MRNLMWVVVAVATAFATVPASAQVFIGADRSGAGVQLGPFGVGVGPRFAYGYPNYNPGYPAEYQDCPLVRERVVTPRGHVIHRMRRVCN